jgi:hypothetical protein
MGKSTGIVLTATAISMGNDWLQTRDINFRMGIAGMAFALIADGIEHISEPAGVGIANIMLITALLTPFNGKAPAQTVLEVLGRRGNLPGAKPTGLTTQPGPTVNAPNVARSRRNVPNQPPSNVVRSGLA